MAKRAIKSYYIKIYRELLLRKALRKHTKLYIYNVGASSAVADIT